MKTGEIYCWDTHKARGYTSRPKYHVYLCEAGWRDQGYTFLFINKSNNYGGDYEIRKEDYPFFSLTESYISCGDIVTYTDEELADCSPKLVGVLSRAHLGELYHAIAGSTTMVQWQINLVCEALKIFL